MAYTLIFVKKEFGVFWSGGVFWVELNAEVWSANVSDTFVAAVVGIDK